MTLQELFEAVNNLSYAELSQLRRYVDEREQVVRPAHPLPPEERIRHLDAAAAAIREGLTEEQMTGMIAAMNEEYVEPFDGLPVPREDWRLSS